METFKAIFLIAVNVNFCLVSDWLSHQANRYARLDIDLCELPSPWRYIIPSLYTIQTLGGRLFNFLPLSVFLKHYKNIIKLQLSITVKSFDYFRHYFLWILWVSWFM